MSNRDVLRSCEANWLDPDYKYPWQRDEEPEQEYPTFDNRMYYIIGTIVVIIVIIAVAFF